WGCRCPAGWRVDAAVHEEKELSLARFTAQLAETRALLGAHLDLYQIHSATAESGCLEDASLLRALVEGRRAGAYRAVGLTLSGPTSAHALEQARAARADGEPVFDVVQATFNCLEPSLAAPLAAAHDAGLGVIVKEALANGRLTPANTRPEDACLLGALGETAGRPPPRRPPVAGTEPPARAAGDSAPRAAEGTGLHGGVRDPSDGGHPAPITSIAARLPASRGVRRTPTKTGYGAGAAVVSYSSCAPASSAGGNL